MERRYAPSNRCAIDTGGLALTTHSSSIRLERILRLGGYLQFKGLMASTQAVEVFKEFKPDLVLLDLRMPQITASTSSAEFKLFVPDGTYLPILILSADLSQPSKQKALLLGAKDFVTKPFDNTEVLLRIENLLETRWLHTQLLEHNRMLDRRCESVPSS